MCATETSRSSSVSGMQPNSPADRLGLQARDVLVALGRYYPTTLDELGELLELLETGQALQMTWLRVMPSVIVRYQDQLVVR